MFEKINTLDLRRSSVFMDPEDHKKSGRQSSPSHIFRRTKRFYHYRFAGLICLATLFIALLFSASTIGTYKNTKVIKNGLFRSSTQTLQRRDGFIIITPTLGRMELLPDFLRHYASNDETSIKALILEWVDESTSPDPRFIDSLRFYPVPIYVIRPNTRSLNERFKPLETLSHNFIIASNKEAKEYETKYFSKAVFSVDDDILIPLSDLEKAFTIFTQPYQTTTRMLGFFARKGSSTGKYITSYKPEYNIVLTKGAFLHHDWLHKYWEDRYSDLRDFVSSNSNCEDILMSYIYADEVGIAPLFFLSKYKDLGLVKGISTKPSHYDFRSQCIEKFNYFFGETTLISTDIMIKNLAA